MQTYQVIVGNIGTVYDGNIWMDAIDNYNEYVIQSSSGKGRAANEPVTVFYNGDIVKEYEAA